MTEPQTLYFDYNATTPLAPEAKAAMEPFWGAGNPSSLHSLGREAARALKQARREIADFFKARDEREIIFTSGGTESNNTAIRSALRSSGKRRIVTTSVEHSSIRKFGQTLVREGYEFVEIPVTAEGGLDLQSYKAELTPATAVVSIMLANNETGILFPVEQLGRMARERGIFFHVDAVQAAGKYPADFNALGADFVSVSAHKFYGPRGIGALYARKETPFYPLVFGGSQERGRRAGTESTALAAGMAAACKLAASDFQQETSRLASLRASFERRVTEEIPGIEITGAASERIPNTSHVRFPGIDGEALLIELDRRGVCASSGSACLSGAPEPSHVLKAMGFSDEEASSAVRFSFGRYTTPVEIEKLVTILKETMEALRRPRSARAAAPSIL